MTSAGFRRLPLASLRPGYLIATYKIPSIPHDALCSLPVARCLFPVMRGCGRANIAAMPGATVKFKQIKLTIQ